MAPFGENSRGNQINVLCPLVGKHLENQPMAFNCEEVKMKVDMIIEDIYKTVIPLRFAKELLAITKVRKKLIEENSLQISSAAEISASFIYNELQSSLNWK